MNKKNIVALLTILSLLPACDWFGSGTGKCCGGHGHSKNEARQIEPFEELKVEGEGMLIVAQGEEPGLVINAPEDMLANIQTHVHDGTLHILYEGDHGHDIMYQVTYTQLKEIKLKGAIELQAKNISGEEFEIEAKGASRVTATVNVDTLEIEGEGATKFNLDGKAQEQKIKLEGACVYNAGSLESKQVTIKGSGSVHATLNVSDKIDAQISGATIVNYKGSPTISIKSSGASSLQKVG